MRMLFRLVILALAAVGAKTVYEMFAANSDQLRETGNRFVDRTTSAAQEVGNKLSASASDVAQSAESGAAEVRNTAREQAEELKSAARDAKDEVAREIGSKPSTAPTTPATSVGS